MCATSNVMLRLLSSDNQCATSRSAYEHNIVVLNDLSECNLSNKVDGVNHRVMKLENTLLTSEDRSRGAAPGRAPHARLPGRGAGPAGAAGGGRGPASPAPRSGRCGPREHRIRGPRWMLRGTPCLQDRLAPFWCNLEPRLKHQKISVQKTARLVGQKSTGEEE